MEGFVISTTVDGDTKEGDLIQIVDQEEYTLADDWSGITAEGVDLSTLDLNGVNFTGAVLSNANFLSSNLSRATFVDADLSNSDFTDADLSGAKMANANLSNSDVSNADLSDAKMANADLTESDLSGADLSGAKMPNTDLDISELTNTILYGTDLSEASLTAANLSRADLQGSNLQGADLWRADLNHANLSNTYLTGATLKFANLSEAKLNETVLRDVELSHSDLALAEFSEVDFVDLSKSLMRSDHVLTKGDGADLAELVLAQNTESTSELVGPLIDVLSDVTVPSIQISALRSLKMAATESELPNSKMDSVLFELLRQGKDPVREVVATEMSSIVIENPNGYPETITALREALEDNQSKVQVAAAKSLAIISYEGDTAISDLSSLKQALQELATQPGIPQERIEEAVGVVDTAENREATG
nr:pentapeptide repeat-containing protein [Halorubrum sp. SD683]